MSHIIKPNKWSQEERLKICEALVKGLTSVTDALGFEVIIINSSGHRQAGIRKRPKGYDLPTVITEGQSIRKELNDLLAKLGVENV
jgi:hypothetical protein